MRRHVETRRAGAGNLETCVVLYCEVSLKQDQVMSILCNKTTLMCLNTHMRSSSYKGCRKSGLTANIMLVVKQTCAPATSHL